MKRHTQNAQISSRMIGMNEARDARDRQHEGDNPAQPRPGADQSQAVSLLFALPAGTMVASLLEVSHLGTG